MQETFRPREVFTATILAAEIVALQNQAGQRETPEQGRARVRLWRYFIAQARDEGLSVEEVHNLIGGHYWKAGPG